MSDQTPKYGDTFLGPTDDKGFGAYYVKFQNGFPVNDSRYVKITDIPEIEVNAKDLTIQLVAGETISGQSLVKIGSDGKVYYFDNQTEPDAELSIGFTNTGVISGEVVNIITDGIIEGMNNLTIGTNYYAGPHGTITAQSPEHGVRVIVGTALSATILKINIKEAIILI